MTGMRIQHNRKDSEGLPASQRNSGRTYVMEFQKLDARNLCVHCIHNGVILIRKHLVNVEGLIEAG